MKLLLFFIASLVAGCTDLPKDPESTLERVRAERLYKVGMTDASMPDSAWRGRSIDYVARIAGATGARPSFVRGATERLLADLEHGKLDLVIASLAPISPWEKQVSVLPALAEHVGRDRHLRLVPIARNGENAWIGLLHREALATRAAR